MKPKRAKRRARSRLRPPWLWIALASVLVLAIVIDRTGLLFIGDRDDMARYHGMKANVVRVVSPHTLDIAMADPVARRETTRIRLLGINAPLPAGPRREAERGAEQAFALTKSLAAHKMVVLHLEPDRTRDTLGRLLAHVELPDGRLLNTALLEAGLARTDDRTPHTQLSRYAKAENIAQRRRRGLWGDDLD